MLVVEGSGGDRVEGGRLLLLGRHRSCSTSRATPRPEPPPLPCSELQSIHLRSLNRQRAEILAAEWVATKSVPVPAQVHQGARGRSWRLGWQAPARNFISAFQQHRQPRARAFSSPPHHRRRDRPALQVCKRERQFLPAAIDCGPLPLRVGSLDKCVRGREGMERLLSPDGRCAGSVGGRPACGSGRRALAGGEATTLRRANTHEFCRKRKFVLTVTMPAGGTGPLASRPRGFQALAGALGLHQPERGEIAVAFRGDAGSEDVLQAVLQAARLRAAVGEGADADAAAAGKEAAAGLRPFISSLEAAGWQTDSFLFNRRERATYTYA